MQSKSDPLSPSFLPRRSGAISRRTLLALGGGAAVSLLLEGCGGGSSTVGTTRNAVLLWNNTMLQAVRGTKPGPPMVARMLAVVSTCVFDAWAAYDSRAVGTRLGGSLRRPAAEQTLENKRKAVSFAAYRALVDLFPTQITLFNSQMAALGYDPADNSLDATTPSGIGNRAAAAVIAFRHADGSNQMGDLHPGAYSDYTSFVPVNDVDHLNDPNHWQPLRIPDGKGGSVVQTCIGPHWGRVIPFAMTGGAQFRPSVLLPQAGSAEYTAQAQQIIDLSANLTDTQKMMAEYFADGPHSELPPGHWYLFGNFVSLRDRHTLDADVKMFFMLGNAVMDAGIACWDAKLAYGSERPITAVRYAFKGKTIQAWGGPGRGAVQMQGENFLPFQAATVVTPPFPEFLSGHSTFSAAGAEVLKRFTGGDSLGFSVTFPKGSSALEPGITPATDATLSYSTFSDAADAAGLSRQYGGIHFANADLAGRSVGRLVGSAVWDRAQGYFNASV